MKYQMISEIVRKLNAIGIYPTVRSTSDIVIDCELYNAKMSTGRTKIEYKAAAYLDQDENVLFFWEYTKEKNAGLYMGASGSTTFQSGKTLFRKVKSVGIAPDGRPYEFSFDLGAIPKIFREVAREYGWKFKTVLKKEKASFPSSFSYSADKTPFAAYTADAADDYSQRINDDMRYTSPVTENKPRREPTSSDIFDADDAKKAKKHFGLLGGIWFVIFAFAALIYLTVFFIGQASVAGKLLGAALLVTIVFLRPRILAKGFIRMLLSWVAVLVVLFFIFAFSIDTETVTDTPNESNQAVTEYAEITDSTGNSSTQESVQPTGASGNAEYVEDDISQAQTVFFVGYKGYSVGLSQTLTSSDNTVVASLLGQINFSINVDSLFLNEPANQISQIYVTNFKIIQGPAVGEPGFYSYGDFFPNTPEDLAARAMPEKMTINVYDTYSDNIDSYNYYINDQGSGQAGFFFCIYNLFPLTSNDVYTETLNKLSEFGVSSDTIRCIVSYDIVITTKDGQVMTRHFEDEMYPGDFIKGMSDWTSDSALYYDTPSDTAFTAEQHFDGLFGSRNSHSKRSAFQ